MYYFEYTSISTYFMAAENLQCRLFFILTRIMYNNFKYGLITSNI